MTLPASMMGTEEPVVYGFDDVLRVCGEDVYLNVEEIVNIYSELTADDSMTELLSMVGITESWLEIPAPTASDDGQLDTILTAITDNLADLETVETDTGVQIAINNDTLLTIAQSIDEAMASVEGTDGESAEEDIEGLEFVSDYILAAAEGFREADPELSEEDSVALVSELVDALLAGVEEEFSMGSDESSDISFAELLSSALEYAALRVHFLLILQMAYLQCCLIFQQRQKVRMQLVFSLVLLPLLMENLSSLHHLKALYHFAML